MRFINKKGKEFLFEMKENRLVALDETDWEKGLFERIDQAGIPEKTPIQAWLKDLEIPVVVYREVFKNKDGFKGERFLVTNDVTLGGDELEALYKRRWGVEEYHKSLKQNASIGSSPAHTERTQSNHLLSAIYGYVKMKKVKLSRHINHFALKTRVYMESLRVAMTVLPDYIYAQ